MKTLVLIVLSLALMAGVPFMALADSRGGGHGHAYGWGHQWSNGAQRGHDNHRGDNGRTHGNDADRHANHDPVPNRVPDCGHHGWGNGNPGTSGGTGSTDPGTGSTDDGKGGTTGGGVVTTK